MFSEYKHQPYFDEMFSEKGEVRDHYEQVYQQLSNMSRADLNGLQESMQFQMMKQGVTFTLYNETHRDPLERTIPVDVIPRIIPANEWELIEKGIKQRITALNQFIRDVYHEQAILRVRKKICGNCKKLSKWPLLMSGSYKVYEKSLY